MAINVTPIPRLTVLTVPAFTLGTANTAGSAITGVASDSTLLTFDATLPDAITFGQSGVAGVATVTSRRDHAHAMASETPLDIATEAEMEAATSVTALTTPGREQNHPGVAKAWVGIDSDGTPLGGTALNWNINATSTSGSGKFTVTLETDMASVSYVVVASPFDTHDTSNPRICKIQALATGSYSIRTMTETGYLSNVKSLSSAFGTQ